MKIHTSTGCAGRRGLCFYGPRPNLLKERAPSESFLLLCFWWTFLLIFFTARVKVSFISSFYLKSKLLKTFNFRKVYEKNDQTNSSQRSDF
jgi:hypothetical protein